MRRARRQLTSARLRILGEHHRALLVLLERVGDGGVEIDAQVAERELEACDELAAATAADEVGVLAPAGVEDHKEVREGGA